MPPDYRHTDKTIGLVTTTLYSKFEGNCLLLHWASRTDTHTDGWMDGRTDATKFYYLPAMLSINRKSSQFFQFYSDPKLKVSQVMLDCPMSSGRALEVQHLECPSFLLHLHFGKCALLLHIFSTESGLQLHF